VPVNIPPYRMPKIHEEFVKGEIDGLLANGQIVPSDSPWGAPIVVVVKNGKKRLCIDYRKLNSMSKPSSYPLPLISDLLDSFNGAKYFSSIELARWQMFLQEYLYEAKYRKGTLNANADALSRINRDQIESDSIEVINTISASINEYPPLSNDIIKQLQAEDVQLNNLIQYLTSDGKTVPIEVKDRESVIADGKTNKYIVKDGILYNCRRINNELQERLVVPTKLKAEILFAVHSSRLAGHLGVFKTYERLLSRYYWKSMFKDAKNVVLSCEICNSRKDIKKQPQFPAHPHVPIGNPMEEICFDAVGPFPTTINGNKHIVVFMCRFTKWCECFAVSNLLERTIARLISEEIITRHGCPRTILSDGAASFNSNLMNELYAFINAKKITITPYNPQHNGQVERFNSTLINMLTKYTNRYQSDWDQHINACQFAYRSAINVSTGYSPFYLIHGYEPRLPVDAMIKATEHYQNRQDYLSKLIQRTALAQDIARANLLYRKEKLESETESLNYLLDYKFGDKVWLLTPDSKIGLSNKLRSRWQLWSILERISVLNYRIIRVLPDGTEEIKLVNVRKLKPHTEPSELSQLAHDIANTDSDRIRTENKEISSNLTELNTEIDSTTNNNEWTVESIIDRRKIRGKLQYKVKWKGFNDSSNSWEPIENLVNAAELVSAYDYNNPDPNQSTVPSESDRSKPVTGRITRSRRDKQSLIQ
jgi:hypothetical protein